ncbi:hypothetical protein OXPF_23360 [Oxobacter pfennigii]|uniref:DUF2344 domain-containing protein n=1 Tax=Oxobacter pfennigii TaxID=36849 RepID=A0A0N8NT90_9CLOT|nr:TIGR03936 family radical SAM-associated protein [Oxobacter pfennigii]KPU44168.1 hypothetical protein OXPF_23360 [Oxobacter pfennigii]
MARYLLKFSKGYGIKFISHLDLMKSLQRAIRRSKIPISYSRGFNPHADFSLATPLAVGTWSKGEYMDLKLDLSLDADVLEEELRKALPSEIKIIKIKNIDDKMPSLMSLVKAASYEVTLVNVNENIDKGFVKEFLNIDEIKVLKQSKKGERIIDIKPMIRELSLIDIEGGIGRIFAMVDCGSTSNLNPELIVDALRLNIKGLENIEIRDIKKLETYFNINNKIMTPLDFPESDV